MAKKDKHYMRVTLGIVNNAPEIYDFLFEYLPKILKSMHYEDVFVEIERLESLDAIYTNLDYDKGEIQRIFREFVKSHHLHTKASLNAERDKTTVTAHLPVKNLGPLFEDYNVLFDLFFTDVIVKTKDLMIDMMDAFNNSFLVIGPKEKLDEFAKKLKKMVKSAAECKYVDHQEAKTKTRKKI